MKYQINQNLTVICAMYCNAHISPIKKQKPKIRTFPNLIINKTAKLLKIQQLQSRLGSSNMGQDSAAKSPWTGCSQFLPTTQKIIQFSDGKSPNPGDKIVNINTINIYLLHCVNCCFVLRFMWLAHLISFTWVIWIFWKRLENWATI